MPGVSEVRCVLELELQMVVLCQVNAGNITGGGSGRPVRALNHGAISPALVLYFPMLKTNMENSLFTVGVNLSEGFSHPSSLCFFLLQSA